MVPSKFKISQVESIVLSKLKSWIKESQVSFCIKAAIHPVPAAVTACLYSLSWTSPEAKTPGLFVFVDFPELLYILDHPFQLDLEKYLC